MLVPITHDVLRLPGDRRERGDDTRVLPLPTAHEAAGAAGAPAFPTPSVGRNVRHSSGQMRREIAKLRLMDTNAPHAQLSSPGLTGRPNIPPPPRD